MLGLRDSTVECLGLGQLKRQQKEPGEEEIL